MITWNRRSGTGLVLALAAMVTGCADEPAPSGPAQVAAVEPLPAPEPPPPAEPTGVGETEKRASGLVYETLKEGTGPQVKVGDTVTVHCLAAVGDDKPFFSTRERGHPVRFRAGDPALIQGWNEGVVGMKVGERRKLSIPPNLAYGALGRLPVIPPNGALDVEIEAMALGEPPADLKAEDLGRRFTMPSSDDLASGKNEWIEAPAKSEAEAGASKAGEPKSGPGAQ